MALFNGLMSTNQTSKLAALRELAANARASCFIEGACQPADRNNAPPGCNTARGGAGAHLTAGLFGIKWVLMALSDGGMNDLAYEMVTSRTYPGLGWMMDNPFANATTIWESFSFSDQRRSHNHPMFSSVEVWLLQSVAGIQPHPATKGMDHILIKPNPPSQLRSATASFESPRGITKVSWKRTVKEVPSITLNVTIPPNCRATVHVPAEKLSTVWHNGDQHLGATWQPSLAAAGFGSFSIEVGSGRHQFKSTVQSFEMYAHTN